MLQQGKRKTWASIYNKKTKVFLRTLCAFSILVSFGKIRSSNPGVRQPIQPHTYARLLIFDETFAQPDFAVVNCSDVVMSVFYSLGAKGVRKVGGLGLNPPLSLIFAKTLSPAQRRLSVFAYYLFVNLSTYCKYHGMNMHAKFKEHCKWTKK